MQYYERVGNLHVHTIHSDGTADHAAVARVAAGAGIDFVIVTDHNTYIPRETCWRGSVLLIVGEEVNSPQREHANHLLVFNAGKSLAQHSYSPQSLIDQAQVRGGLCFIAHPYERSGAYAREPEINWEDWRVKEYTGIEIWNYMSEFKSHLPNVYLALLHAFWPRLAIRGPYPETLSRWDQMLSEGRTVGIGGSDAHGTVYRLGPLRRAVLSYDYLFRALNTHVLLPDPWSGDAAQDATQVYDALKRGRAFVGYDGLRRTHGFRFTATNGNGLYTMGDRLPPGDGVEFNIRLPARAYIRLLHNGKCVAEAGGTQMSYRATRPGTYRVEAYRRYAFRRRGWIFSNPIYIRG